MSIFANKQNYMVKSVLFISFLFIISLGLIGGCSDDNNSINATALTENDFAENSSLRAKLDEGVIATLLESPISEVTENDTGTNGVDEIPVVIKNTTEQTFCWEDDDEDAMHFMELRDSEGNIILTLEVNGDCVTEVLEPGNYVIYIYHDENSGDALAIFLIPDPEESEQARKTEGIIDRVRLAASNILERIEATLTRDALAQTAEQNERIVFNTNKCVECNLEGAFMGTWRLSGADLSGSNMKDSRLRETILIGANLSGVDLTRARLDGADLTDANLSGAILNIAAFNDADLIRTDMSGASMRFTLFQNADLTGAILIGVNVREMLMRGATWCDGMCVCNQSAGCNGCPPAEEVCTGP